jgi:C4-dicarboxylate-specific signal transduction histidine kinase
MHNRRILIVDDNVDIHSDFRKILSPKKEKQDGQLADMEAELFGASSSGNAPALDWSYEISSAYQGQEALQMVEQAAKEKKPYALVFMDVRMPPGWDGIETIRRIWEKHPCTEIVLCTAYSDYTSDDIISTLGISHRLLFMKKPFDAIAVKQMALAVTTKWNFEDQSRLHVENLERAVQERTQDLEKSVQKMKQTNLELDTSLQQLHETQSLLLQASKMSALGEMAGGIAHEINTPLGTIGLMVSQLKGLIEQGCLDQDEIGGLLNIIDSTTHRIATIVSGLRSFSRQDSSDPFQNVSVKQVLDDTLILCLERMKNHGVDIQINSIPANLCIDCRATQISQVLLNLLNNAFDAVENLPEKWIKIEIADRSEQIEIAVSDSGPGIRPQIAEKIFQPFFTTKEIGKGTGLGLSISQGILKGHKGKLTVGGGKNTQFIIQLPKSQPKT